MALGEAHKLPFGRCPLRRKIRYLPRASAVSIPSIYDSGLRDLPSLQGDAQASASDEIKQVGHAGGFGPFLR